MQTCILKPEFACRSHGTVAARFSFAGLLLILILTVTGCQPKHAAPPPVLMLDDVLTAYNNNISSIEPFYAKLGKWKSDEGSDSGGRIYYYPPVGEQDLPRIYIQLDTLLKPKVVMLVSEQEYYGMMIDSNKQNGYWGRHKNIGKPCSKAMPINISSLMETLTLKTIPVEKIMAYKITDKYNIIEYVNENDLTLYLHEVFFDRYENIPKKICIYSIDGKKIIESTLDKFKQVESGPMLPTRVRLDYLPNDAYLELKIDKYSNNPKDKNFLFKIALEQVLQFEQLDKDCPEE